MKARDLMIGSLIKAKSGAIGKVIHLTHCTINAMPEDSFEPIQLTPEILEKNGFICEDTKGFMKKVSDTCYKRKLGENSYITVYGDVVYIDIQHGRCIGTPIYPLAQCKYVHEFQLSLYQCGLWELAYNFQVK